MHERSRNDIIAARTLWHLHNYVRSQPWCDRGFRLLSTVYSTWKVYNTVGTEARTLRILTMRDVIVL